MATLEIPKDVLDPIINAHVTRALTEVFGNGGLVLQQVVQKVLSAKVDSRGEPDRYGHGQQTTIEWMAHQALKEAAKEALTLAVAEHKEAIKAAIVRELSKSNSKMLKELASNLVEGFASAADSGYRVQVTVTESDR